MEIHKESLSESGSMLLWGIRNGLKRISSGRPGTSRSNMVISAPTWDWQADPSP